MSEWQLIETAPRSAEAGKSGPSFLAYEDGMMAVGSFFQWRADATESFHMDHVGGYEYDQDINNPTHWMPLPNPPSSSEPGA